MSLRDVSLTQKQVAVRAEQMRGLLEHAGWARIVEELEAERDLLRDSILAGVDDYVMYRQYCARLEAVTKILDLPQKFIAQAPGGPDA